MKSFPKKTALSLSLWVAAIGGSYLGFDFLRGQQFARAEEARVEARDALAHVEGLSAAFRKVGKVVEPSVVKLDIRKKAITVGGGARRGQIPDELRDEIRRRFPDFDLDGDGGAEGPDFPFDFGDGAQMGTGSGVIMEAANGKGYILTNNHVAGGADEITITLADGRELKNAKVLGADAKTDLAVIEVKADRLSPAAWGDSDELQKGDFIMAFGSPFGYIGSMSHGIVSALNRQAGILSGVGGYENFIQVDAPINPGNSGGPLVNLRGEVVGINTAIATRNGGFQGIGFAIPSNQAKFIYTSLKENGKVVRGWLGVKIDSVSNKMRVAESFGYERTNGVLVEQVFPQTPATGKLKTGDIITEIDGKPVNNLYELRARIATLQPNHEVKLNVYRNKKLQPITITLGEQPEDLGVVRSQPRPRVVPDADLAAEHLGFKIQTLTPELARKFGSDLDSGAIVTSITRNSPAAREGLAVGDIITQVGDDAIKDAEELLAELKKHDLKKGVRLYVTSGQASRFVFISTEK